MGRARRTSKILEKAQVRSAGLKAISPAFDLGVGLTLASFDAAISDTQAKLEEYNQALAAVDKKSNDLIASEKALIDIYERMLAGVGAKFGKDSTEYEQAGGIRKSERKPRPRKPKTPPVTT